MQLELNMLLLILLGFIKNDITAENENKQVTKYFYHFL